MNSISESQRTGLLLQRAAGGDRVAVEELINSHRGYLRRVVELWMEDELRSRVDPSDVVQETQLVASQRLDDYLEKKPTSFRIWLRGKALDQVIEARRRHLYAEKRSVRREVSLAGHSSMFLARKLTASQHLRRQEQAEQVRTTIEEMPEADREILLLRHIEELSNAEIAEVLQLAPATASQRYGRALRRLREKLVHRGVSQSE